MALPRLTRRTLMGAALGALAASHAARLRAGTGDGALDFLALGDWGAHGSAGQRSVAAAMADAAHRISPRLVISLGDNFYRRGVSSEQDPQWQATFETVYADPALQCPWYAVLGNHDHLGSVAAEQGYGRIDPRWHLPAPYYAHSEPLGDGSAADFFFLDTTTIVGFRNIPAGDPDQVAWLAESLAASRTRWKIVVGHHPVYSDGRHGGEPLLRAAVEPLLRRHGVAAYLNGHDHDMEHVEAGGIHYLTCGAGSQTRRASAPGDSRFLASRLGFLAARLSGQALAFRFVDVSGAVLHRVEVAPPA